MPSVLAAGHFLTCLLLHTAPSPAAASARSRHSAGIRAPARPSGVRISAAGSLVLDTSTSRRQLVDVPLAQGHQDGRAASLLQVVQNRSRSGKIPNQLVLTGKWASLEQAPDPVAQNVRHTLSLNPDLRVRWLGDAACGAYLRQHFDGEFAALFEGERRGSFRGDLCRAAVLSREGGFYTDLDVEWKVPMRELVDTSTSFMSAFGEHGEMLNALIAVEPRSEIMEAALRALRRWYKLEIPHQGWMGPVTLLRALQDVQEQACPGLDLTARILEKSCGPHKIRLYEQRELHCNQLLRSSPIECPPSRARSHFDGLQFGLFEPGPRGKLVGWPRFAGCGDWGCGGGGWSLSKAAG